MRLYSKLCVKFEEESVVDFDQLLHDVQSEYQIGFAALYGVNQGISMFIQREGNSSRMALEKINKICSKVAEVVKVVPFDTCEGQLIDSFGNFRPRGGKVPNLTESLSTKEFLNTTNSCNNSHNTTVHLHINALGEEDISHITKDLFEDFVGSREDVVGCLETALKPSVLRTLEKEEWGDFRSFLRKRLRLWDKQNSSQMCATVNVRKEESDEEDSDKDSEEEPILIRAPIYDPDSDSEGNLKRKRQCMIDALLTKNIDFSFQDLLTSFNVEVYENPHNNNVKASTKDAYFKYFDGERWIKCQKREFFEVVTTKRAEKLKEAFDNLEGGMSEFTKDQASRMIDKLVDFIEGTNGAFEETKDIEKKGILEAEKQRSRLAHIEKSIARRIECVGKETLEHNVVRDSTWELLVKERFSNIC